LTPGPATAPTLKRREEEGVAKVWGPTACTPKGPKPPVWILTGETVGNKPVKVFLRVSEIDTIEADELTAHQRPA